MMQCVVVCFTRHINNLWIEMKKSIQLFCGESSLFHCAAIAGCENESEWFNVLQSWPLLFHSLEQRQCNISRPKRNSRNNSLTIASVSAMAPRSFQRLTSFSRCSFGVCCVDRACGASKANQRNRWPRLYPARQSNFHAFFFSIIQSVFGLIKCIQLSGRVEPPTKPILECGGRDT